MMKKFFKKILLVGAVLGITLGCKTQNCIPTVDNKDSIRTEYRIDSVYIYARDSIFIDRYRSNDTVYLIKEKWYTRYKDKIVEVHDTITINKELIIVLEVKVIPKFYLNCTIGFWIVLVLLLAIIVIKVILKIYLRK